MLFSKREGAARTSARLGITAILEKLPQKNRLLVLNYHRIGDAEKSPYDPGTFSATADELATHLEYLKHRFDVLTLDSALNFLSKRDLRRRTGILITFDDGYLDNYRLAFPVLRSFNVQGVFFLATSFVGSSHLPWWDVIAYIVKCSIRRQFRLEYPESLSFDLDRDGLNKTLRRILSAFKTPAMQDQERFLSELEEASGGHRPSAETERLFLSWTEAREMQANGMAFGSHTHRHEILSKLSNDQQYRELAESREILEGELRTQVDVLAYPVGARHSFSGETVSAAQRAGYRGAFSCYGGSNAPAETSMFDIHRYPMERQSLPRLRLQTALASVTVSGVLGVK
jgi:peptidoglycan/xylan/chitin deacetylase (PgdA/CDA1 family)